MENNPENNPCVFVSSHQNLRSIDVYLASNISYSDSDRETLISSGLTYLTGRVSPDEYRGQNGRVQLEKGSFVVNRIEYTGQTQFALNGHERISKDELPAKLKSLLESIGINSPAETEAILKKMVA